MLAILRGAVRNPTSLGERAVNASLWSVGAMGVQYPLRLIGNLIMTRLLAPEAFGLMATIVTLHMGLSLLSDVGITQSVMRHRQGDTPRFLRTAWTAQILRGLVITGLLLALAGGVFLVGPSLAGAETVYADPRLPGLICFSAVALLLAGFNSTSLLLERRRMRLKGIVRLEILSQLAGFVVMIALALVFKSVWALVAGLVMSSAVTLILSHVMLSGPRMRIAWERAHMSEIWSFGKWLIGASLGGFLVSHGDRLLLAALIDKTLFGIYAIAVLWVQIGTQVLERVGNAIFVPSFSAVMNSSPARIGEVLESANRRFGLLAAAVAVATALGSILVIEWLYDPRYHEAVGMIVLLAFRVVMQRYMVLRQFIVAAGDSRHSAFASLVGGIISLSIGYLVFQTLGFLWSVAVFAVGAGPMFALILPQRDLRRHIEPVPQLLVIAGITALCMIVAAQADGFAR